MKKCLYIYDFNMGRIEYGFNSVDEIKYLNDKDEDSDDYWILIDQMRHLILE